MYLKKISVLITIFLIAIGIAHGENIQQKSNQNFDINEIVDQIKDYSNRYNLNQNQFISVINYACSYYPEKCLVYNGQLSDAFMSYAKNLVKSKANEINQAIQENLNSNNNNEFFKISPESSQRLQKLFIQFSLLAGPSNAPENLQQSRDNTDAQNIINNANVQQIAAIAAELKAKQDADAKAAAEKEAARKLKHDEKAKHKEEKEAAEKAKQEQEQKAKDTAAAAAELKAKQEQEQKARDTAAAAAAAELKAKQEQEQKARDAAAAAAAELKAKQDQEAAEKAKQQSNNNNNSNIDYLGQFLDFMDFVTQSKNTQNNNNINNNNINLNQSPAIKS